MRCLSLVVRASIAPTPRPYEGLHDYCLFYARGACGACMKRCPSGAITAQGHDTRVCRDYLSNVTRPWVEETFGFTGRAFDTNACGLCQTGVPCEAGIPEKLR
jgi:epoxyqueuosine reductase